MKSKLTGTKRSQFFLNQGIRYGAIGYYKDLESAWNHFKTFKPFRPLEIGEGQNDKFFFSSGFNRAKAKVVELQLMKLNAEAICKEIMAGEEEKQKALDVQNG